MSFIKCHICGTNSTHTDKHRFIRTESDISEYYLISYFKTPFWCSDGNGRIECEKNRYVIYPPNTLAEHGSLGVGFVNDWIFLRGEGVEKIIQSFNLPLSQPFSVGNHGILERYITKIQEEMRLRQSCFEERSSAIATEMLVELGRRYELLGKESHPAYRAIYDARSYILTHSSEKISVSDLAARAKYSVSRFCVLYKEFFSVTPIEELLNSRIESARSLLEYNRCSVTETAELCGFSSLHYFSRKFKEIVGVSPSEYAGK